MGKSFFFFFFWSSLFSVVVADYPDQSNNIRGSQRQLSRNGTSIVYSTGYIVGGSPATGGNVPWFVHFGDGGCGGSLISPNRVLTAAHCVKRGPPTTVRIGATSKSNGQRVRVHCANRHPDYNGGVGNDVAVLKLKEAVSIPPVVLNADPNNPSTPGQKLTVIGLGRTCTTCPPAPTLLTVDQAYVSPSECDVAYGGDGAVGEKDHLCAVTTSKGSCNGDSGGPLFDSNFTQVGIVSFGSSEGCASGIPDGYTRISSYIDWINQEIESDECDGCSIWKLFCFQCRQIRDSVVSYVKGTFQLGQEA